MFAEINEKHIQLQVLCIEKKIKFTFANVILYTLEILKLILCHLKDIQNMCLLQLRENQSLDISLVNLTTSFYMLRDRPLSHHYKTNIQFGYKLSTTTKHVK